MYRLVLYGLSLLALIAFVLGFARQFSFSGLALILSIVIILFFANFSNVIFSKLWKAPRNVESVWITGFILFFLLQPATSVHNALILAGAAVIAMLSKYVLAIKRKHIFNPAAVTAVIIGLIGSGAVIWWMANPVLNIFTLVIGLLIVRKLRRGAMVLAFSLASIVVAIFVYVLPSNVSAAAFIKEIIFSWQLIFFGLIMFTEPLTTPPTKKNQIIYGIIVGALFSSQLRIGTVYATPEMSLIIGNIFSYLASYKLKLKLRFLERKQLSSKIYDFAFLPDQKLFFKPGQYLEWTLPHDKPDTRGNRRFFTIASSPTEKEIHLSTKIDQDKGSTFKKKLFNIKEKDQFISSHLAGDFVLPKNTAEKLVFIAGGIGVTPYRSMIKYLADKHEKRNIHLFYQAVTEKDFAYQDLFEKVKNEIGLKTTYIVSEPNKDWQGETGRITPEMIRRIIPDFSERTFYLSGPDAMVENYESMLGKMGIEKKKIITDYFPGY